ncbi:MAG: HDIG domain-containing metalloprotein [Thermodesulfobacteriota bacterium]
MDIEKRKKTVSEWFVSSHGVPWGLLVAVTLIFTGIFTPSMVSIQHTYQIGDVADRDIKAPADFFIEDIQATQANRRQAVESVLTVYDHDVSLLKKTAQRVEKAFAKIRSVLEAEAENQIVQITESATGAATTAYPPKEEKKSIEDQIWQLKPAFEKELGFSISKAAYRILIKERFSEEITDYTIKILSQILENGVVTNKDLLLRDVDRGIALREVDSKNEHVEQNLKSYYGHDQAKTMVRVIGQPLLKDHHHSLRDVIVDFVQELVQPNITLNKSETEERKKRAAAEVKPVLYQIKAGEMLLREGERVAEVQLLKLKAIQGQVKNERLLAVSSSVAVLVLCLFMSTYLLYLQRYPQLETDHNKNLLFIASVLVAFFILARVSASVSESMNVTMPFSITAASMWYGIPIASAAMTVCLFMGLDVAIPVAMVLAVCSAIIFKNRLEVFIYFLINGFMAAYWIQSCRERKVFIKAGAKLGCVNVVLATAINMYMAEITGLEFVSGWIFAFLGGIGAGIITAGIAPIVEIAFGYPTDITLLELANLDRPILRRLMIEAPGTYHHSVIVGSLVEAAASEVKANPLLAKVSGYYHDIGKIRKPLYFIENQANGKNRHDKLAPSMSSLILIAHVKNGVEIARENKLPQVIIDSIRQHHGTSLISYFFDKARQLKGEDAVKIDNFRYPGPKPQTREAALVMLADVVEAASRTLENPTPARIQGLVQHLINKIFSDGQLDHCELTLKDLDNIAKSFNKILNGIHHHRIEYSESSAITKGKGKNGGSDQQPAKQNQDNTKENGSKGPGRLKRLGIS